MTKTKLFTTNGCLLLAMFIYLCLTCCSCQFTSDTNSRKCFRINAITRIINKKPIAYNLFDGIVHLSIYDEDIKELENDSIYIGDSKGFPYYLKQNPRKRIFSNSNDLNKNEYVLIIVETNEFSFPSGYSTADKLYNIIGTAIFEKNIIIESNIEGNETIIEKCRFYGEYIDYYFIKEKFYVKNIITVKVEIHSKLQNINFNELFLMKNSIVISDEICKSSNTPSGKSK